MLTSSRHRLALVAACAAAVTTTLLPLGGVSAAPAPGSSAAGPSATERRLPSTGLEYVALGDSWTADVVILNRDGTPDSTHAPIDCAQSHRNYPKILAEALSVGEFRDASCGSATTDDFPVTDSGAGLPFGGCKAKYTANGYDEIARNIRRSEIKLVRAFRAIHAIAPGARILAIDYINVVPDHGCYPTVPASDEDMAWISRKFRQLNKMVKRAARRGGAEFVNTYRRTPEGVDLCGDPNVRWAEVYGPSANDPAMGVPAHPNAAGARGQAAAIMDHLRRTDPDVYR